MRNRNIKRVTSIIIVLTVICSITFSVYADSEPFLGEIQLFAFPFAPKGWAQCNGQLLPINQNQALFSLLGTQFGGNGQTTFALPNLNGRAGADSLAQPWGVDGLGNSQGGYNCIALTGIFPSGY
jgi:microcystin-dependent protein